MARHVTVRLFWHDTGWDGAICRDPAGNVWCEAHDHVRLHKDVDAEVLAAGQAIDAAGIHPGCEMSSQAFALRRNEIRIHPPDWMAAQGVGAVSMAVDERTAPIWPYEHMWGDDGSMKSNEERRAIVDEFLQSIEPGKSLVFFYVDERNPLFVDDGERSTARLLVGIARVESVGEIHEWDDPTYDGTMHMVWAVPFKHSFPYDGIRLPVQAVRAKVGSAEDRLPFVVALDSSIRSDFRYGSSPVSMDRAVAVVERSIGSLQRLQDAAVIDQSVEHELAWLNSLLLELWEDRGPYPGIAPMLMALGCARATEIQQTAVRELFAAGDDPATAIFAALDTAPMDGPLARFSSALFEAGDEWSYFDDDDRALARVLARMELTPHQAAVALNPDRRERHGLPAQAADLIANPYLLCERFVPARDEEPLAFVTVDHGLVPHEGMAMLQDNPIPQRDPRRLRALLTEALHASAADGHTFLDAAQALDRARAMSPDDRPCDVPLPRLSHPKVAPHIDETLERFDADARTCLALRSLRRDEQTIETLVGELAARGPLPSATVQWKSNVPLSSQQTDALQRLLSSPISVLTGAAGTGKSTLLQPLITAIQEQEGHVAVRALTPTGKAADRLSELGVPAMTIHRALASAGWFDWELGIHIDDGDAIEIDTLIVDEASMVDVTLLATLVGALESHALRRLILVGDHHQLPPIGPGRPFFDVIGAMRDADAGVGGALAGRLCELTQNYRAETEGSQAIRFASGFAREAYPDDPLLWTSLAQGKDLGDLRIRFWTTPEELHRALIAEVETLVRDEAVRLGLDIEPDKWFDAVLGHDKQMTAAHWQIIAPMRGYAHGTRKLNAVIQDQWHGGWKQPSSRRHAVRFGDEAMTVKDKVIQTSNERLFGWNHDAGKRDRIAIFNGQIGVVSGTYPDYWRQPGAGRPKQLKVRFDGLPNWTVDYGKRQIEQYLELAYAITVHKAQGSQFKHVFFVVPKDVATVFGRELTYTGLTRAETALTLFVEGDIGPLLALRKQAAAQTPRRNSRLLGTALGVRAGYRAAGLVHGTSRGELVRSKSEVIVANLLHTYEQRGELTYAYEEELYAPSAQGDDLRLPDFTVRRHGQTWYWEHCGMVDDVAYMKRWDEVRRPWYTRHGYGDRLVVTRDAPGGVIESASIELEIHRIIGAA